MNFILAPLTTKAENSLPQLPHFTNNKGAYSTGSEPHNKERDAPSLAFTRSYYPPLPSQGIAISLKKSGLSDSKQLNLFYRYS